MSRFHFDAAAAAVHEPLIGKPERLVGLGFRYWMLGCQTGDIDCWAEAWNIYRDALGCREANLAVTHLSSWVQAVNASACRDIAVQPLDDTDSLCRDERLAVTMVAACQHDTCPALRACAFALVESALLDDVVQETETFSVILRSLGQLLTPRLLSGPLAGPTTPIRRCH